MTRNARIALVAAVVVAAVVAFIVISPGGGSNDNSSSSNASTAPATATSAGGKSKPAAPTLQVIRVKDGKPVGGIQEINVKQGDTAHFRIVSDTADEIHVHGYDLKKDVPAGGSVSFSFPAKIGGVFVVELENHGEQIAQLKVT